MAEDPRGIRRAILETPVISTDGLKVLENLPNYVSDLLSVSTQAARNYNQNEVEPVDYFLSSLVCIQNFEFFIF